MLGTRDGKGGHRDQPQKEGENQGEFIVAVHKPREREFRGQWSECRMLERRVSGHTHLHNLTS